MNETGRALTAARLRLLAISFLFFCVLPDAVPALQLQVRKMYGADTANSNWLPLYPKTVWYRAQLQRGEYPFNGLLHAGPDVTEAALF